MHRITSLSYQSTQTHPSLYTTLHTQQKLDVVINKRCPEITASHALCIKVKHGPHVSHKDQIDHEVEINSWSDIMLTANLRSHLNVIWDDSPESMICQYLTCARKLTGSQLSLLHEYKTKSREYDS